MWKYIGLRIVDAVPTVILVLSLVFVALRLLPGDPAQVVLGDNATAAQLELFRKQMGLDAPLWHQYLSFMYNVATLRFGRSLVNGVPIIQLLAVNLPYTIQLTIAATFIGVALGIPLGVVSARHRGEPLDDVARIFALLGYAVPDFYLGAIFLIYLSLDLGLFPINGTGSGLIDQMHHLVLPALTLGLVKAAFLSRLTRASLLEVLSKDYVRTARAKGAREGRVIYRHALRNALLPVVTGLGLSILATLSGSVAIELVFGRPGIGNMLIGAVETRDYPVVQAGIIVFALFVVLVNLAVDLLAIAVDPRIRVR
jgi:peptide/nickel transport system permease protein